MSQIFLGRLLTPAFSMLCGLEALNVRGTRSSAASFPALLFFNAHKLRKNDPAKGRYSPEIVQGIHDSPVLRQKRAKGGGEESVYRGEERPADMLERTQPSHLKQIQHASRADMQLRPGASGREGER